MVATTTSDVPGFRTMRVHGFVHGNTSRRRHLGKEIFAILRHLVGGEIPGYTRLMAQAREQAIDRMVDEARGLGANAIVCVRFQTQEIMKGASEVLCFGTAVTLGEEDAVVTEADG